MINFLLKRKTWQRLPKTDPGFYRHFHLALTNYDIYQRETVREKVKSPVPSGITASLHTFFH